MRRTFRPGGGELVTSLTKSLQRRPKGSSSESVQGGAAKAGSPRSAEAGALSPDPPHAGNGRHLHQIRDKSHFRGTLTLYKLEELVNRQSFVDFI